MRLLSMELAVLLALGSPAGRADDALPKKINIVTLEGQGAVNNLGLPANKVPSVRIEDESQKPVRGANVVFVLPADGASGEFRNGSQTLVVQTDDRGVAAAQGLRANLVAGRMPVHVHASHRGLTAGTDITQFNMAVPGRKPQTPHNNRLLIFAAIAGGAVAGGYFGMARKNSSGVPAGGAPGGISITPGSSSVGPPR